MRMWKTSRMRKKRRFMKKRGRKALKGRIRRVKREARSTLFRTSIQSSTSLRRVTDLSALEMSLNPFGFLSSARVSSAPTRSRQSMRMMMKRSS